MLMTAYELRVDARPLLAIEIESPAWLPVQPRVRRGWLRFLVASALRKYFATSAAAAVVKAA